jgi:hypothetical protein
MVPLPINTDDFAIAGRNASLMTASAPLPEAEFEFETANYCLCVLIAPLRELYASIGLVTKFVSSCPRSKALKSCKCQQAMLAAGFAPTSAPRRQHLARSDCSCSDDGGDGGDPAPDRQFRVLSDPMQRARPATAAPFVVS